MTYPIRFLLRTVLMLCCLLSISFAYGQSANDFSTAGSSTNSANATLKNLLPSTTGNRTAGFTQSGGKNFLPVEQAFQLSWHQEGASAVVTLTPANGYYLYRNKIKFDGTRVHVDPVILPDGIQHQDEVFGATEVYDAPIQLAIPLQNIRAGAFLQIRYQGCTEGLCYPPQTHQLQLTPVANNQIQATDAATAQQVPSTSSQQTSLLPELLSEAKPAAQQPTTTSEISDQSSWSSLISNPMQTFSPQSMSLWGWMAFWIIGLGLSLTPCMYPMYPVLSAMLAHQQTQMNWRRGLCIASAYVAGMATVYTLLGIAIALIGLQLQNYLQSPWLLGLFSLFYLFLGIQLLRDRGLQLPLRWQNQLNQYASHLSLNRLGPIVVLGGLSGLIGSPCTSAPLSGILLYIAQQGSLFTGALALFLLSLGMGTPLLILGIISGRCLPRAGRWMLLIKQIFAFLLLAMPVFLLSRFLTPAWTDLLWRSLIAAFGIWLVWTFWPRSPRQSPTASTDGQKPGNRHLSMGGMAAVFFLLAFAAFGPHWTEATQSQSLIAIHSEQDLQQQLSRAKAENRPVMLDFYANWCVACQELEEKTFSDPNVQQQLQSFVRLKIDLSVISQQEQQLMQKFQIVGLPNVLFFDKTGQQLQQPQIVGFVSPQHFSQELAQCHREEQC